MQRVLTGYNARMGALVALIGGVIVLGVTLLSADVAWAQPVSPTPPSTTGVSISMSSGSDDVAGVLKLVILMTIMALVPAILMTMTCFTRIIIVFAFLRQAMGTQQTPPNQVLIGLSLFLTLFIMAPTFSEIEQDAYQPYIAGEISTAEAIDAGSLPLRDFMLKQTRDKDLGLFYQISGKAKPTSVEEVPLMVVAPAFILSELKTAFEIGFLVYVPFLIVDMLIASILMSMGMMMLPPVVVSLPFKLLLFVMIDGWFLIVGTLIQSFAV